MDDNKYRKFYVDWWNIRKSTIYGLIAFVLITGAVIGGGWWASRNNWFVPVETGDIPKDAARIVSFEGEVRITRAATRETILVTKATWVAAGDTIQTQSDGRAIIQMIDGSVYSVRPNSTVVVRDTTSLFGGKNVRVRVDDGQLNVRTDEQPAEHQEISSNWAKARISLCQRPTRVSIQTEEMAARSASAAAASKRRSAVKNDDRRK